MPSLNLVISSVDEKARRELDFRAGDTVRVWQKVKEKESARKGGAEVEKTRLQAFEGIILARSHGREPGATFTVRKVVDGIGVEKIFPLFSPAIERVEVLSRAKFKRAKLFYVRDRAARDIRKKMKSTALSAADIIKQRERQDRKKQEELKEARKEAEQAKSEAVPTLAKSEDGAPTPPATNVGEKAK